MAKKGTDPSALMDALAAELRRDFDGNTTGLFTISMATLTLLIDAGVIERRQVLSRLQEFYDSLWDEHRNGRPPASPSGSPRERCPGPRIRQQGCSRRTGRRSRNSSITGSPA
jgi:hypothetical protein